MGGYLGSVVALAGLWIRRHEPIAKVTLLVAAAFPVGYFVFWGTYLSSLASRISGPIYLVPLYGVVCILAAVAIDHWWNRSRRRRARRAGRAGGGDRPGCGHALRRQPGDQRAAGALARERARR